MKSFYRRAMFWVALSVAIAVVVVGIVIAFGGQTSQVTAASPAPEWLQTSAAMYVKFFEAKVVTSTEWIETTRGQYVVAVGSKSPAEAKAMETSVRSAYVVVLHGEFVSNLSQPASKVVQFETSSGQVLVLTFDPVRKDLTNIDLLRTEADFDEASLGQANPLAL